MRHLYHTSELSNDVYNFVQAQGAQKLQLQVQKKVRFTKENGDIKLRRLVTFECLELEQSYIHHLKALMCGINASRGQGHGCRFTMCHASLKMTLLLHTEGLVKTALASTVKVVFAAISGVECGNKLDFFFSGGMA